MSKNQFVAIRCPLDRAHGQYQICSRLLCLVKDKRIYLYCNECKTFSELIIKENDQVEMKPLSKEEHLDLKTSLRVII